MKIAPNRIREAAKLNTKLARHPLAAWFTLYRFSSLIRLFSGGARRGFA